MIGRYVVYPEHQNTWRVYDKFRDTHLCYEFDTKEEAYAYVRELEER